MGFPNLDQYLQDLLLERLNAYQGAEDYRVDDLLEDRPQEERHALQQYLYATTITGDIKRRGNSRHLYVLPHFPLGDIPFPQIGITTGEETAGNRFLGNETGAEAQPVYKDGTLTGWDLQRGYWSSGVWMIEIAAPTKLETIWLSRLVHLAIADRLGGMDADGIKEVTLSMADLRPDPQFYPQHTFLRGIRFMAGAVAHTWNERIPASTYVTGDNVAL